MTSRKDAEETPVREELIQLRADIDHLVGTVGRLANGATGAVVNSAKRTSADAGDRAEQAYEAALAEGRRQLKAGEHAIKEHPYMSIAIAAGIGLLVGRLISRP
jgi:ElaB/YqjD/DUF883 family membrane-anchored ribosome-binding protein